MKKLAGCALLSCAAAFSKDLDVASVFDLTMGEPFAIRECKFEVSEQQMGMEGVAVPRRNRGLIGKPHHVSKMVRYTEAKPATDKCFQRVGPGYTSSPNPGADVTPGVAPNNQKVKLVYADSLRPGIADSEDIWVGIQDTKLTGIRFYFQNRNEANAFQALVKKYGQPASNEKFDLQMPNGQLRPYYRAQWNFPKLQVTFLSLDTNQIGYDPQDAPIGYRSEVGSVTIQYKAQAAAAKPDNNPL